MKIVRKISELRAELNGEIGFVPTMGAFHEGHLSLMRKAKAVSNCVVVSLFVNPLQFGDSEDLANYPRDEANDFRMAEQVGVDIVFAPHSQELVGNNYTSVHVSGISELWEGEFRPGHFDGVATIVCKLFNIVGKCSAIFGLKDYQQCMVIRQMVSDLNLPVNLMFEETIREADGLALSSRNALLSSSNRDIAPKLFQVLTRTRDHILSNRLNLNIDSVLQISKQELTESGFDVEYLSYVDSISLIPKLSIDGSGRLLVAAKLANVRLIDNVAVE